MHHENMQFRSATIIIVETVPLFQIHSFVPYFMASDFMASDFLFKMTIFNSLKTIHIIDDELQCPIASCGVTVSNVLFLAVHANEFTAHNSARTAVCSLIRTVRTALAQKERAHEQFFMWSQM